MYDVKKNRSSLVTLMKVAISLLLGGAFYWIGARPAQSWWWDGFYLILAGSVIGTSIGLALMVKYPSLERSDGPFIFGNLFGVLLAACFWL